MSHALVVDEMPRASFVCQRRFSLEGMGALSLAIRQQLDDFLEQRLGVFPATGVFFPGCHCSTVLLYLFAHEQGGAPWELPLAGALSPAARGSDLAHLPSNGCRAGMGTRWSHRLLHGNPILLLGG